MSLTLLKTEALKLDKLERLKFAQFIIDSIVEDETEDFELSENDLKMLDNRVTKFRQGESKGLTWDAVLQNLRSKRKAL